MYRRIIHDIIKPLHIGLSCLHLLDHFHQLVHRCDKIHLQRLECNQHTYSQILLDYPESTYSQYQKGQNAGQGLGNLCHNERDTRHLLILQNYLCLLACPALEEIILQSRRLECLDKAYTVHGIAVQLSHLHLSFESTVFKRLFCIMKNQEVQSQHTYTYQCQLNIIAQHDY